MIPGGLTRYCHRWWPVGEGAGVCTLRHGHGGTYCVDAVHNRSHPTADTNMSAWERALARRQVQES
jgi:hypothetical protein